MTTYKDAGVDIDAGNRVVSLIKKAVTATYRPEVCSELGGFGALFHPQWSRYKDPVLVSSTDGVGTKLKLAFLTGILNTVGIDLVAMSVNDLIVQGAEPWFFLDYFATGKLEPEKAATVIEGIAQGCRLAGCALIGGETAEMPDFYPQGEFDLAGFAVGMVEREAIINGQNIQSGDVLIGLASSGPHSNGYSLIRRLILSQGGPGLDAPFAGQTLGEVLLAPTKIYVKSMLELFKTVPVKGIVHITGGGFQENIPRILPMGVKASINRQSWTWPPIFDYLQNLGHVPMFEMMRTFNCGLGMVVVVGPEFLDRAMAVLHAAGETCWHIGHVVKRQGDAEERVVILD
ncbi:MAG: phosphoribosylformylglycinamidine cyclo-ligase [Magnetococcales bacterium]|nr:phosphoribosylformylglycinamidine cyclo-ligase [Magnetococcales bacterium]MBF0150623.1 phosphoribosylformylglycinamidine cyclo-ligase [Magnetococcales bacterium]MBF0174549.1 phosphoribosylformylglycinamidine cyclo-ligase [Magnetococcales bacterium]MBF0348552.1 phosphoribosylformylglycinamidine cyclo-ligase [Magnetococcales bacterium]MBF0629361.1 phosphoribosylformylglycinamidine cyclo-ligase [Magnetococcales bacterium]